jgi:CBS domain-containing protein
MVQQYWPQVSLRQLPLLHLSNLARSAVWINLLIAAINLLPAFPLDGGRVLRALLSRHMDYTLATRRAVNLGNVFVVLLMFAGLWNTWLMLTGFFLFVGAQLEERTVLFQSVLENVRMEEVMLTEFSTLSPADTLEDALSKAVHTLQDDFPVVRGTDMVGVVSRQKILQALRDEGNAYVQSIMNRAYEIAGKNDTLASAFRKITSRGLTIIPVVDQERLVGIVTLQNLMHSMSVLAESKKLRRSQEEE